MIDDGTKHILGLVDLPLDDILSKVNNLVENSNGDVLLVSKLGHNTIPDRCLFGHIVAISNLGLVLNGCPSILLGFPALNKARPDILGHVFLELPGIRADVQESSDDVHLDVEEVDLLSDVEEVSLHVSNCNRSEWQVISRTCGGNISCQTNDPRSFMGPFWLLIKC